MNPVKRGWEVVKSVSRKKKLFSVLIFVQILFIISVSFIGVKYQVKIYDNVLGISETMEKLEHEEIPKEEMEGMVGEMLSVAQHYKEMVMNIFKMVFLILCCFLLFNGFSWSFSNHFIKNGCWLKCWGKFVLVSLLFLVPVSLAGYFILKSLIGAEMELFELGVKIVGWIFLITSYFLVIGFCLLDKKPKELLKKMFVIGVKKAHWVLLGLLFGLSAILVSFALVYFSFGNVLLMFLSALVLVVVLVLDKLFLIGVVEGIRQQ
jgi:hypothetical protein